jgi:hypothetical protein
MTSEGLRASSTAIRAIVTGASRGVGRGIAVVWLYPGLVRTEKVMESAAFLDLTNSESPRFTGRAVAALARDRGLFRHTGRALLAAQLAREYGFAAVDCSQPRVLARQEA